MSPPCGNLGSVQGRLLPLTMVRDLLCLVVALVSPRVDAVCLVRASVIVNSSLLVLGAHGAATSSFLPPKEETIDVANAPLRIPISTPWPPRAVLPHSKTLPTLCWMQHWPVAWSTPRLCTARPPHGRIFPVWQAHCLDPSMVLNGWETTEGWMDKKNMFGLLRPPFEQTRNQRIKKRTGRIYGRKWAWVLYQQ